MTVAEAARAAISSTATTPRGDNIVRRTQDSDLRLAVRRSSRRSLRRSCASSRASAGARRSDSVIKVPSGQVIAESWP